jgi:hypothetical protein
VTQSCQCQRRREEGRGALRGLGRRSTGSVPCTATSEPFDWAAMIAAGSEPRRRMLCTSFSMCAHVNGEDFVRREPGFSANQCWLA